MFESAELGHSIDDAQYKKEVPALRASLLDIQFDLAESRQFPVIILIAGMDGAGKGEVANLLNEWMDPRKINTHAFGEPTQEEAERPPMWRYWRALPPKGEIAIFFGSWYAQSILGRVYGEQKKAELDTRLDEIIRFERMLTDEGTLIIKVWLHLSKEKQKARFKLLQKNPETRWRVTETDLKHQKLYDKFHRVSGHVIRQTSTASAPWVMIEGYDANYRNLTVAKHILNAIKTHTSQTNGKRKASAPALLPVSDKQNVLNQLDLTKSLSKSSYETQLEKLQGKLNLLTRHPKFKDHAVVVVFEGPDAAGKGGSIRRLTHAIDARFYKVVQIAAPSDEEKSQPYLWRFWRYLPRKGHLTIYDRSWYGRVLVERVEGYCSEQDWMRAYAEINDFEEELIQHQTIVVKFWLQISPEEQLNRFESRQKTAFKRFKITEEDWRNRDKSDAYQQAVCDMVDRTSTGSSPWHLIEANDKYYARIRVLRTLCERIETLIEA